MAKKDENGNIEIKVVRNFSIPKEKKEELLKKAGGSNIGQYTHVKKSNFAGNACGLPGAYPIDTIERARSALAYAHNAKNPECILKQVYKKYPSLKGEK